MKVVYNTCYGGFGLSSKAMKRIADLLGRDFFVYEYRNQTFRLVDENGYNLSPLFYVDTADFPEIYSKAVEKSEKNGDFISEREVLDTHEIPDFEKDRANPILVQVVEELKEEANGRFAKLAIKEIPDNAKYLIEEYDGVESVEPGVRSWF